MQFQVLGGAVDIGFFTGAVHRVANVVTFLAELDDPAFHFLDYFGYLPIDSLNDDKLGGDFTMCSFNDLFLLTDLVPSLNQRLSIAYRSPRQRCSSTRPGGFTNPSDRTTYNSPTPRPKIGRYATVSL